MARGVVNLNGEQLDRISKIMDAMKNAPTEATEKCQDGSEHEFKAISHADSRDSYLWLFECEKCGDFVRSEQKRTGDDLEYWSD